ncbi:hypothetical protein Bca4012_056794 [Brassica carinata]|uniref:Uncharacterized protein n=1 Tax=Brassica carinata TaxID=52824 RepID=A0A8X7W3K4_BRACI|nr:hypothetical protein Bca52824_015672 [Brassica carinata]
MDGFELHCQTSSAKNQLERFVSNPALRTLISLQVLFGNAMNLVEERIYEMLISLRYTTNRGFEDGLLIVKVVVSFHQTVVLLPSPVRSSQYGGSLQLMYSKRLHSRAHVSPPTLPLHLSL